MLNRRVDDKKCAFIGNLDSHSLLAIFLFNTNKFNYSISEFQFFTRFKRFRIIDSLNLALCYIVQQLNQRKNKNGLNAFGEDQNIEFSLMCNHFIKH